VDSTSLRLMLPTISWSSPEWRRSWTIQTAIPASHTSRLGCPPTSLSITHSWRERLQRLMSVKSSWCLLTDAFLALTCSGQFGLKFRPKYPPTSLTSAGWLPKGWGNIRKPRNICSWLINSVDGMDLWFISKNIAIGIVRRRKTLHWPIWHNPCTQMEMAGCEFWREKMIWNRMAISEKLLKRKTWSWTSMPKFFNIIFHCEILQNLPKKIQGHNLTFFWSQMRDIVENMISPDNVFCYIPWVVV